MRTAGPVFEAPIGYPFPGHGHRTASIPARRSLGRPAPRGSGGMWVMLMCDTWSRKWE